MISLNKILRYSNHFVFILFLAFYAVLGGGKYCNILTAFLVAILYLEIAVGLRCELNNRSPFVLIASYYLIFYYILRFSTILYTNYSDVFERFDYGPDDTNYGLAVICLLNAIFFIGLLFPIRVGGHCCQNKAAGDSRLLLYVFFVYAIKSLLEFMAGWSEQSDSIVSNVLKSYNIFIVILVYCATQWETLCKRSKLIFYASVLIYILTSAYGGSRSSLVTIAELLLLARITTVKIPCVKVKHLKVAFMFAPFIFGILYVLFELGTQNHYHTYVSQVFNPAVDTQANIDQYPTLLNRITARAGFVDFNLEVIAHLDMYKGVLNMQYMFESIVDNVFTPGFDIFDRARISNSLHYIYRDIGMPLRSNINIDTIYKSDQIGIYAEFYALFGIFSSVTIFLVALIFNWLYKRSFGSSQLGYAFYKFILLLNFKWLLNSYGIDFIIGDNSLLLIIIIVVVYLNTWLQKRRTNLCA